MAGRLTRALADRAVDPLCEQRPDPYRGGPRQDHRLDRQMRLDDAVLADEDGVLIAGHLRISAAAKLGLNSVPVVVARAWSEEEKRAYRVADNELAARANWDDDLLRAELQELDFAGFDLDLIGFDPDPDGPGRRPPPGAGRRRTAGADPGGVSATQIFETTSVGLLTKGAGAG
jgi:hypothetical protein